LCKHAWGEPEEYAQQALKAGLKGIIFTCHCPMPNGFWPTVRMSESEFDTYVAIVQRAADAFKGKLDIRLGIESEYYPGCEEYIASLHNAPTSTTSSEPFTGRPRNTSTSSKPAPSRTSAAPTSTTSPNPPNRVSTTASRTPTWSKTTIRTPGASPSSKTPSAAVLDRIAATGVAMELNTSGLNKSYSEMNPGLEMLRMMAERKIPSSSAPTLIAPYASASISSPP
jgi:hypothetical protein